MNGIKTSHMIRRIAVVVCKSYTMSSIAAAIIEVVMGWDPLYYVLVLNSRNLGSNRFLQLALLLIRFSSLLILFLEGSRVIVILVLVVLFMANIFYRAQTMWKQLVKIHMGQGLVRYRELILIFTMIRRPLNIMTTLSIFIGFSIQVGLFT